MVAEERDYVGALTRVVRVVGGEEVATDDPEELKHVQIITEVGGCARFVLAYFAVIELRRIAAGSGRLGGGG